MMIVYEKKHVQATLAHYAIESFSPTNVIDTGKGAALDLGTLELELTLTLTVNETTQNVRFFLVYGDSAFSLSLINGYFVVMDSGDEFDALNQLISDVEGLTQEEGEQVIQTVHNLAARLKEGVLQGLRGFQS